ncbi:MAG: hypothetical protein HZB95_00550 [Nitrosomonadales bacterium]|nr:hypothetical protein [Nitrosomonadales bacterium]
MDPLVGINSNLSLASILSSGAITPSYDLLAAELSLSTPGLFSYSSTFVGISAQGRLLSAAVTFQDELQSLQPGTATNYASLAAKTESFVDIFNTLQSTVASINNTGNLPLGGVNGASDLVRSIDTQVQASYANGDSTLTDLSQLGIGLQPALLPGGSSRLSVDLDTLRAAFDADAAGASALLAKATDALGDVARSFISSSGSQYSSIDALQSALGYSPYGSDLFAQTPGGNSLYELISSNPFPQGTNLQQVFSAINEYTLVSRLFG